MFVFSLCKEAFELSEKNLEMFLTIWNGTVSQVQAVGSGLALRICVATS